MDYTKPFRYILEIASCQSISLAAEKLNMQQPALSKYLKKVEAELGLELFDRSTSPLKLTKAGENYIETAHLIIDADNQLQKKLSDLQSNNCTIRIGISPSRAPHLLPAICKTFLSHSPDVKIVVQEGTTSELQAGLRKGTFDLIISLKNEDTKDFEAKKLFDESIYLAIPKPCPFTNIDEILQNYNLISSGKGQILTSILKHLPLYKSQIECQNILTALSMVTSGIGVTLVPSYIARSEKANQDIHFFKLPTEIQEKNSREVFLFYRKEQYLSSSEKLFIDCCLDTTKSF